MAATNALNYIDAIPDKKIRRLAKKVRTIIKKSIPEADESLKMGMPCYTIGKSMVASIADYRNHVNLYFFQGAGLSSVLLEGTGKGMRHIRIEEASYVVPDERSSPERSCSQMPNRILKRISLFCFF